MDVRLINPFIESTLEVFQSMVGVELESGVSRAATQPPATEAAVSTIVTMRGGAEGSLILIFPRDVVGLVVRHWDESIEKLDDILDAIGELGNMVCGSAKHKLSNQLIEISVPAVVVGRQFSNAVSRLTPWLIVPFEGKFGSFDLAVSFQLRPDAAEAFDHPLSTADAGAHA